MARRGSKPRWFVEESEGPAPRSSARARGGGAGVRRRARGAKRTAKPDASLDDALRPLLAGADAVTQFFVRLENELDYGAGARSSLAASLG